jgi:cytochrome c-type biogenesis protein
MRYPALVTGVALLGVAGYGAYLLYPRFNLPAVDAVGLVALALGAGVAAFFSPCSFPLLATLLTREIAEPDAGGRGVVARALVYATAVSIGAVVFLAATGSLIAAGGQALVGGVTFTSPAGRVIRAVIGLGLVVLGLVQLERLRLPFGAVARLAHPLLQSQARIRRRAPAVGFAIFGFVYLVAGFG